MTATKSLWLAALAGWLGVVSPGFAQESVSGFYAGATLGEAHWRGGCPAGVTCDNAPHALRAFGGYQINRTFAAEVAFANLGITTQPTARVKGSAWEVAGVASWPLFAAVSVYGRLGVFRGKAEGSGSLLPNKETNYGPTYGIGAQVDLSRNLALRGEWQNYPRLGGSTIPKSDINVISVGGLWRFR